MSDLVERLRDPMGKYLPEDEALLRAAAQRIEELERWQELRAQDVITLGQEVGKRDAALSRLIEAGEPFARVYAVSMRPFEADDDEWPSRYLPSAWPVVGQYRALSAAIQAAKEAMGSERQHGGGDLGAGVNGDGKTHCADALQAKLAALEAEAQSARSRALEEARAFVEFVLRHTMPARAKAHGAEAVHSIIAHHPFILALKEVW